jgi:hypothetical protein
MANKMATRATEPRDRVAEVFGGQNLVSQAMLPWVIVGYVTSARPPTSRPLLVGGSEFALTSEFAFSHLILNNPISI